MQSVAPRSACGRPHSSATMSTPGRNSAPSASSAIPAPPAAPAPGTSRRSRPSARAMASAVCASAASSFGTSCGFAPFCGPKIADAPFGPQSGLSTSEATRNLIFAIRGSSPERSMLSMPCSAFAGCVFAPSARKSPTPASLIALPPMPMTTAFAPASSAARISSPVPRESARQGSRSPGFSKTRPLALASSTMARSPSSANVAIMGRPSGS